MSHSRLMRSYSCDGLAYRNNNDYGVANYDYLYRRKGMDCVDTLENDQEYQPRDRCYDSLFFHLDEKAARNNDPNRPDKGRHVTWAPMPESYAHRDRVADNLGKSPPTNAQNYISSSTGRILKPPCPIHGHQRTRSINEILGKIDLARSARNPQTSISNLYDLSSSCRYPLSSYYSRLCAQVESPYPTYDDLRNPSRFRSELKKKLRFVETGKELSKYP